MGDPRVVRFPREDGGFVLVHVSHRGPERLDLDLKGTENENPYFASIYQNKLSEFKSKTKNFDEESWFYAVAWAFLRAKPIPEYHEVIEKLEVLANIDPQQGLVLKFRQNLEKGLKPFVGSIVLPQDDNQELDLFEWAGLSTETAHKNQEQVELLSRKRDELAGAVESMKKQLDDLQRLKKEEEDTLLEKFRQLLNFKKLKIRDQQRLLAGAKVDPDAAKRVQNARKPERSNKYASGRSTKRKVDQSTEVVSNDDVGNQSGTESEDEFESMASPEKPDSEDESVTVDGINSPKAHQPSTTDLPFAGDRAHQSSRHEAANNEIDVKMEEEDDAETDDEL